MYGLMSKLAEILSTYWSRFLDGRQVGRDTDVAAHLVRVVLALQDLCVRGEWLLTLAEKLADGDGSAEFEGALSEQVRAVDTLRSVLADSQGLLATIDAQFYLDLAPIVDQKSGLLERWSQQVSLSRFSTTTLVFLSRDDLARLIDIGRLNAGPTGMDLERTAYLIAVADSVRDARSREVRDIRTATARGVEARVRSEIASARADLMRARGFCSTLLGVTEAAVGSEAMARLRRRLLPEMGRY